MNNMIAIFKKQIKDTFKNKTVLIQFVMFPVLTVVMNNVIQIEGMPKNFFVSMFAAMYVGMAPLTSISAVIAEEKEQNTLRVLLMSNVKPQEYLLGVGSYIWIACMLGASVMCAAGSDTLQESLAFLGVMAAGILTSLLLGAAIGTRSKNQMTAASVSVPVMMVFSFLPMLAMFNTGIAKVARFTYSQQVVLMLEQIDARSLRPDSISIVCGNILLFTVLFILSYKKCGLD